MRAWLAVIASKFRYTVKTPVSNRKIGALLGRRGYLQLSELHYRGWDSISHFSNEETKLRNMK